MLLQYLAHGGIDHTNEVESVVHSQSSNIPIILAVTAVVIVGLIIALKFISKADRKED